MKLNSFGLTSLIISFTIFELNDFNESDLLTVLNIALDIFS
ncbi:hypothetical protein NWQ33_05590 [Mycoplasmopsis cynos]|nr:hypothetical protein [Mycoplasmopsis cynos]